MSNSTRILIAAALAVAVLVVLHAADNRPAAQDEPEQSAVAAPAAEPQAEGADDAAADSATESEQQFTGGDDAPWLDQGGALPRLLSLGAGWCRPCKMMDPVREELRDKYRGKLIVEYIDLDNNRAAGNEYSVRVIPTIIFYDAQGSELNRREGYMSAGDIVNMFADHGIDLGEPL